MTGTTSCQQKEEQWNNDVEHNQCDQCGKKFSSALGFHHHYPKCISEKKDPIGYQVHMYHKSGGCIGTWKPTLHQAMQEIKKFQPHEGMIIVKVPYSQRGNRFVIQRAKNLDDSGIYPKTKGDSR